MESYDTVIIGAGLAGLQCARLLARDSLKVLLVDRKAALAKGIHTTGIFVRKTLEDFDIPAYCLGPPIRHVSLYSPSLRAVDFVSSHDEFRIGRMGPLYDHYLNECISSGVTWLPSSSYLNHSVAENGQLTVNLASSRNQHSVSTRYLIGGDGARSHVARDLKLDTNSHWIVGVEKVFVNFRQNGPPRLLCFIDPDLAPGYIGWIACDGEEAHVGVGGYPARFDPLAALSRFELKISSLIDLRHAEQVEQRGGQIPIGGVLCNIANERGMLIGDAAGAVSPLTAGGLDPCMRLSSHAAKVVVDFLRSGDRDVLRAYSGARFRTRFSSRIWSRRIVARLRQRRLLEVACFALRLPVLNAIAHQIFFGRSSFPDVEIGDPLLIEN